MYNPENLKVGDRVKSKQSEWVGVVVGAGFGKDQADLRGSLEGFGHQRIEFNPLRQDGQGLGGQKIESQGQGGDGKEGRQERQITPGQ